MILHAILFYAFSLIMVASAVMVISVKNPVNAVLFLIFAFFNAAGLFVLLGAELLAMLLIIVYVGAVAVLFLFVVMMLDINYEKFKEGFLRYLPLGLIVAAILFAELYFMIQVSSASLGITPSNSPVIIVSDSGATNTEEIGNILYTQYMLPFQLAGLVLLVAMISAIVLTLRVRPGVKKQNINLQLDRNPKATVKLVKTEIKKGI